MPDVHIRIEDQIAEGGRVAVRITLEGTHSGGSFGVAAQRPTVRVQGIIIGRVVDGQIVEAWNSYFFIVMTLGAEAGPPRPAGAGERRR